MDTGNSFLFPGQLPTWLEGILLRNGPGMHTIGDTKYNHWFDGLALLHSFTFKNGKWLHIGLKGTQEPTFWSLNVANCVLNWIAVLWVLFAVVCEGGTAVGESLHTPPHAWPFTAQLEHLCRAVCREMLHCPFFCCAQVQCCCHPRTAQTQLWAGHCRTAFSFYPGQENLYCF